MKRAVITGLGPVTPIGIGRADFWEAIESHRSGIDLVQAIPLPAPGQARHAAEIRDFHPETWFSVRERKRLDRFAQFAVLASRLALTDSGFELDDLDEAARARIGMCFGTALGGFAHAEHQHRHFVESGIKAVTPSLALQVFGATAHTNVAIDLGLHGPGVTNANSCAAGNVALGEALRLIRSGEVDVVIAGGVEAPIAPLTFAAFDRLNTMSRIDADPPPHAYRPFDRARDGFVIAEGAAVLIVEEREQARRRGAHIYAELAGYAQTTEAHHMTTPEPSGRWIRATSEAALADARIAVEAVDHVNTHGSGTPQNDLNEGLAIQKLFGSRRDNPRLTVAATKAATGHPLGAAGAVEALITALSIDRGLCPATLHLENPEPEVDLSLTPECRAQDIGVALNHSFGFGGINSTSVLRADSDQ